MRGTSLIFAFALIGCGGGKGALELSITASPPIAAVDEFDVSVTNSAGMISARTYNPPSAIALDDTALKINLQFASGSEGMFSITVTAKRSGMVVGSGGGAGTLQTGQEGVVSIDLHGGLVPGDMAIHDLGSPSDLSPPDASAPLDLSATDSASFDAAVSDLTCVPGCQGNLNFTCVKAAENCAAGCVPANMDLPAHCALVPSGNNLCGGGYGPAQTLAPGKYVLDADANNNNLPRIHLAGGPNPGFDGLINGDRIVFCLDSLDQSGMNPVIIDANTPGYPMNLPLAIITKNGLGLTNTVIWLPGTDGSGPNSQGVGRNGGSSGAPAATSANIKVTGGLKGTDAMGFSGGGGGGNKGGNGGDGSNAPNTGGKSGQAPIGFVGGGGGGGGGDQMGGGSGGAGGGALQLSAGTKLTFSGAIYVMGGRGAHGSSGNAPGGGGGGGGGGTVLFESPSIEYLGIACVMVNGGFGGTGFGTNAGSGGGFSLPMMPTCPIAATVETAGAGGGGLGGVPAIMDAVGSPNGSNGQQVGSGGGGAGGPGALQQRALKAIGMVTVYPNTLATNVMLPY